MRSRKRKLPISSTSTKAEHSTETKQQCMKQATIKVSLQFQVLMAFNQAPLSLHVKNHCIYAIIFTIYMYHSSIIIVRFSTTVGKKQRCCLVHPGFMHTLKKQIDSLTKHTIPKLPADLRNFESLFQQQTCVYICFD